MMSFQSGWSTKIRSDIPGFTHVCIGTSSELKVSPHDLYKMALETTYEVKVNETYLSK